MKKVKIIVVAGATATGKTALGVQIAKAVSGEVISADSMQVYKGLAIASAAPTIEEQCGIKHHMVSCLELEEEFNVSDFCEMCRKCVQDISNRGKTPIIVGGTGLFIDSFVDNITFLPVKRNESLRHELEEKSADELYDMLLQMDKTAASNIHPNNKKRVIRALEICMSGETKTHQNELSRLGDNPYETLYFVIEFANRELLYKKIDARVDKMFEEGIVDEARECIKKGGKTSLQAIGPKELIPYFEGRITIDEAKQNIKTQTHRYAKRQITWFKRRNDAIILTADTMSKDELYMEVIKRSKEFLNE